MSAQAFHADTAVENKSRKFRVVSYAIPVGLVLYGVIGLESHTLKDLNLSTQGEITEHLDNKVSIDDFSQYSPALSVYVLNAAGVKGKHKLADRTKILATAYLIMGSTVNIIKKTGRVLRPDGTSTNSFPSGHTATAFMGAEFLFQEYKHRSVWYGIAGYAVAAGTGLFRMYNNRHWLTDVAAGAGIGILSTKIAYLLYPVIQKKIFKHDHSLDGMIIPTFNGTTYGASLVLNF